MSGPLGGKKNYCPQGTWVAQSVERLTLDFHLGHIPGTWDWVLHQVPCSEESLLQDSLSLSFSPSLSQINKWIFKHFFLKLEWTQSYPTKNVIHHNPNALSSVREIRLELLLLQCSYPQSAFFCSNLKSERNVSGLGISSSVCVGGEKKRLDTRGLTVLAPNSASLLSFKTLPEGWRR